jgi:GDP-L-fucose synthase
MNLSSKIYIAGHNGMVGKAIWNALSAKGYTNLIGKSSKELDLRDQQAVKDFFETTQPDIVIDAAARVGGILANNNFPYNFLMENLQIQNNLIDFSFNYNVKKFIFLGSSCIYPKLAPQPLQEESLLTSSLEPTNEWYAIAKITGVKACEALKKQFGKDFISLMPTNLYGTHDNFDLETSHVMPAMIRKFHEAKIAGNTPVELWGTGTPMREFLHVQDLADAVVFSIENQLNESLYNIGSGSDITIKDLALIIQEITGHTGEIIWNTSKPDGTPRKLMDVSKIKQEGWESKIELKEGIKNTYNWFLQNIESYKKIQLN